MTTSSADDLSAVVQDACATEMKRLVLPFAAPDALFLDDQAKSSAPPFIVFAIDMGVFELRFHALVDDRNSAVLVGRKAAAAVASCLKNEVSTIGLLNAAEHRARDKLAQIASNGLSVVAARPRPMRADLPRAKFLPEVMLSGIDAELGSEGVALVADETLESAVESAAARQLIRMKHTAMLASTAAAGLIDTVTLAALVAAGRHHPGDLPRLYATAPAPLEGLSEGGRPWQATLYRGDGVLRVRGAPDHMHLWRGDRLVLRQGIGGRAAKRLVGRRVERQLRHPWIDDDAVVTGADASGGRWLTFHNDVLAFDRSGRTIDPPSAFR